MKYPNITPLVALAAVLAAGPAAAQSSSASPPTSVGAPAVVTDVGPPPAHERDSMGAIVLEDSPVRAQRDRDFEQGAVTKPRASAVGRKVLRSTTKAKARADLREAREAEAVELYRRGAAGQIEK
jgi:hypothetical protein